jgi:hypothetical protein
MAREGINLIQQIGVQSVLGTPVAATKRLASIGIDIGLDLTTKQFRSHGAKANTTSIVHKVMSSGTYEGPLSYVEIVYLLAGLSAGVPVTGADSTVWTFTPNGEGSDTFSHYTLECGDDEDTEQYADLMFTSLEITWGLEDLMVSGNVFAKTRAELVGLSVATLLAERPVSARDVSIYCDTTYAGIGGTPLTDAFDAKLTLGDKFAPKWVLHRVQTSYKEPYEMIGDKTFVLTIEANSQGRTLLASLITNAIRFFRVESEGGVIAGTDTYRIRVDFAAKLTSVNEMKDYNDGIFAYELTFTLIQESTLDAPYIATVRNALSAL